MTNLSSDMTATSLTFQSTVRLPSGHNMPRLGFGVGFGYGKTEDLHEVSKPSILKALEAGYRHFDTAEMYENEHYLGEAIRESGVKREDLFVTSKVPSYGASPSAVDNSLKNLGLDYIDLYLIHSPPQEKDTRLKFWKGLLEAKHAGKIRTAGVSNYNVQNLEEIKNAGLELPSVNQVELHPLDQKRPIVEYCMAHGIVMEAYCPILRGHFDNPVIAAISKKVGRDHAQVLLRWSLQRGFIPVVRSSNPDRIVSNRNLYDFELDEDDMKKLNGLDKGTAGAVSWNPIDTI